MRLQHDAWLTSVLDRDTFSVHGASAADADPGTIVRAQDAATPRAFYFAKLSSMQVAEIGRLSAAGFRVVESSMVYSRPTGERWTVALRREGVRVETAAEAWRDAVLDIAGSAFRFSRFHLDPAFDLATAHAVKREWIRSYFDGRRGDRLLVALDGETPVGFLALLFASRPEGLVGVIDLVGVHCERQAGGIGESLVAAALDACRSRAATVEVGTQSANVPSIRLYERCGFRLARSGYVLHRLAPEAGRPS